MPADCNHAFLQFAAQRENVTNGELSNRTGSSRPFRSREERPARRVPLRRREHRDRAFLHPNDPTPFAAIYVCKDCDALDDKELITRDLEHLVMFSEARRAN
jgi:hypothetical protein